MKKIIFSLLVLTVALHLNAQNPYDPIGKKTRMLTLTKGKYPEYHIYDSIQRIGSVVINVKRGAIVKLLEKDSLAVEPQVSSRWWSVDPNAHIRVEWTPYNAMRCNPIMNIDPDGALDDDYTAKKDGSIEFKKTDDKFDRFLVEKKDGKTEEVFRVDKPDTKKQELIKFPDEGKGFTRYGTKDPGGDHYVKPEIAAALLGAVNEFSEKNPGINVQFGDMSNSLGQRPNATHSTHAGGRNVDFRYIRTDNAMQPVDVNSPKFDVVRSQDLINAFNKFGFNSPKSIGSFPNNKGILLDNTFKLGGHADHGHLQNFNQKR